MPKIELHLQEANMFVKKREVTRLGTEGISTTRLDALSWSPAADNAEQPAADVECWRDAHSQGRLDDLEYSFMGAFCNYQHCLIFRRTDTDKHTGLQSVFPLNT